jgi:hypothetical protein
MPKLAQTLHGYDQGHRLLASGGDLDSRELALLERLSDLSGYLPRGTTFDCYHTGFPCGRYYALACTWLDTSAPRAGTVLTHTLLLPREQVRQLEDPWALATLHRHPQGAQDREPYQAPLTPDTLPSVVPAALPAEVMTCVVTLLFGTTERPILWVDETRLDFVVRLLWSLLDPEERERFAFCTLALQLRSVEGRRFDFLGLPPTARGSFLEFANSEAWWDSGRLLHPRLEAEVQKPWAQALGRGSAAEVQRLRRWCQDNALAFPEQHVPLLWRFLELEPAAAERLAAARTRADLLERLWPSLEPAHPMVDQVLQQLLSRQQDAVLQPRPFWELTDLLQRSVVRKQRAADTAFASRVEAVFVQELARRLELVPEVDSQALEELLAAYSGQTSESRIDALRKVVATAREASTRLSPAILLTAARSGQHAWAEAALAPLDPAERHEVLDRALQRVASAGSEAGSSGAQHTRDSLLQLVAQTAEQLDDTRLLFIALSQGEGSRQALHAVCRSLVAHAPASLEATLQPLLAEVGAAVRLDWALEESLPQLGSLAASVGARAAQELALPLDTLVHRCAGAPHGARLVLDFARGMAYRYRGDLTQALRQHSVLARNLLPLLLREGWSQDTEELTRLAVELAPEDRLLDPEIRSALLASQERWRSRELLSRLGPQWIRAVCERSQAVEELARWLDIPGLRQWLRDASTPSTSYDALARVSAVLRSWLAQDNAWDVAWIAPLLEHFLARVTALRLDEAAEDLAEILRRLQSTSGIDYLFSEVLNAVSRTRPDGGWRLVEVTFPRAYHQLARAKEARQELVQMFGGWLIRIGWADSKSKGEERARPLRHWLIDTYVSLNWPPESLLRCVEGDTQLFRRLAARAARSYQGMAFLRRMLAALETYPELASRWRYFVADVLANPYSADD